MSSLADFRKRADSLLADYRVAEKSHRKWVEELELAEEAALDAEEAQRILQLVAQTVQQQAHDRIAGVVSACLESVFEEPYEFRILFEQKRGRTEAKLVFVREGQEIDPMTASGGGVIDVASFALRLSCLMLAKPPPSRVLLMDEPFKFVSERYRGRVRAMQEKLAKDFGVQIIQVTHIPELISGNVIRL